MATTTVETSKLIDYRTEAGVAVITMTDPRSGRDLPDPLGGFDGCLRA